MSAARATILTVDDDPTLLKLLGMLLKKEGFHVLAASSGEQALAMLATETPQLILTDLRMGGMDGLGLFEEVHRRYPLLPVIILTAHGTIPDAVEATRRGVFGFVGKPYEAQTLLNEVNRALQIGGTPAAPVTPNDAETIITRSPAMRALLDEARIVAETDASVLILGDTGAGKELLARTIHDKSPRHAARFIAVNCGAIPENLLESELFGHTKGAFTGATRDHTGLFQEAEGGTLFLDEIGDMPLPLQVKLLRVLQEREVRPVGSARSIPIDVRLISATHRDLETEIAAGRFREDLYYRLNVVNLNLPPLSDRREDIPLLAQHFLQTLCERYRKPLNGFASDAMDLLLRAPWPGNVRQLYNVVEKCIALATAPMIPAGLVERALNRPADHLPSFEEAKRNFERDYLVRVLKTTQGNVTHAAQIAKRNRTDFYTLLKRHEIDPALFK